MYLWGVDMGEFITGFVCGMLVMLGALAMIYAPIFIKLRAELLELKIDLMHKK